MALVRPTILQIIPHLQAGGAETTTIEVADAIVRAGGRALVLSEGGRLESRIELVGGEAMRFPAATKNPLEMLANVQRLRKICLRENVDLIHARSRAPAWSSLATSRILGIPFVTTYHGAYKETNKLKNLYNSVMARSNVVIANSQYTAQSIRQRYHKPPDQIAIVSRGVDLDRFKRGDDVSKRAGQIREVWGVDAGRRVILHLARLTPLKGQAVVIEAARRIVASGRFDDAMFILAGGSQSKDAYAAELAALIASHGLTNRIRLVGHVEDVPAAMAAADLALMVSVEPEGFGRVAAEAQAMGCPVIVSNSGALPESLILTDIGRTGWVVPAADAVELAHAIDIALRLSPTERITMGNAAAAHIAKHFTAKKMQVGTLKVYDGLLGSSLAATFGARAEIDLNSPHGQ